jgi:predicted HicB family RNase H-like nuclease
MNKQPQRVRRTVTLDAHVHQVLRVHAATRGGTVNDLIEKAVNAWVKRNTPKA